MSTLTTAAVVEEAEAALTALQARLYFIWNGDNEPITGPDGTAVSLPTIMEALARAAAIAATLGYAKVISRGGMIMAIYRRHPDGRVLLG